MTSSIEAQIHQELPALTLTRFTNDDAWEAGKWAVGTARERGLAVTIDIRRGDHQLFHAALANTSADNDSWVERKIRSVRRFAIPSLRIGQLHPDFNNQTGLPRSEYVADGGCVPVLIDNVGPVGTITVSGLTETEDHVFALEIIDFLRKSANQDD